MNKKTEYYPEYRLNPFNQFDFSAPLMSVFLHQFGLRVTTFTGGLISVGGLFICAYATSIYHVIILLGVISGEDPGSGG